jgi:hypothetical protein
MVHRQRIQEHFVGQHGRQVDKVCGILMLLALDAIAQGGGVFARR